MIEMKECDRQHHLYIHMYTCTCTCTCTWLLDLMGGCTVHVPPLKSRACALR